MSSTITIGAYTVTRDALGRRRRKTVTPRTETTVYEPPIAEWDAMPPCRCPRCADKEVRRAGR